MALEELLQEPPILPRFTTGSNPTLWISQAERYFLFYAIYDDERFPYVIESFDDEPFWWFNGWYRSDFITWNHFTTAMLTRFHASSVDSNEIEACSTNQTQAVIDPILEPALLDSKSDANSIVAMSCTSGLIRSVSIPFVINALKVFDEMPDSLDNVIANVGHKTINDAVFDAPTSDLALQLDPYYVQFQFQFYSGVDMLEPLWKFWTQYSVVTTNLLKDETHWLLDTDSIVVKIFEWKPGWQCSLVLLFVPTRATWLEMTFAFALGPLLVLTSYFSRIPSMFHSISETFIESRKLFLKPWPIFMAPALLNLALPTHQLFVLDNGSKPPDPCTNLSSAPFQFEAELSKSSLGVVNGLISVLKLHVSRDIVMTSMLHSVYKWLLDTNPPDVPNFVLKPGLNAYVVQASFRKFVIPAAQRGNEIMVLDCGDLILIAPMVTQLALCGSIATTNFAQELKLHLVSVLVSEAGDIKHHCHTSLTSIQTLPFHRNVAAFEPIREAILVFFALISDSTASVITHIMQNYILLIWVFGIVLVIDDDTSMGIRARTLKGLRTSSTNNVVFEFQVRDKRLCWKGGTTPIMLMECLCYKCDCHVIAAQKFSSTSYFSCMIRNYILPLLVIQIQPVQRKLYMWNVSGEKFIHNYCDTLTCMMLLRAYCYMLDNMSASGMVKISNLVHIVISNYKDMDIRNIVISQREDHVECAAFLYIMKDNFLLKSKQEMHHRDIRKARGFSWTNYKNKVCIFSTGDKSGPYSPTIYAELEMWNLKMVRDGFLLVIHVILAISNLSWMRTWSFTCSGAVLKMQLFGLTSLSVASKFEPFWHPRVRKLIDISTLWISTFSGPYCQHDDVFYTASNYVLLMKSFFDLKSILKLITFTQLCFCYDALHGVVGAYANHIIVEALDAKESSSLNTLKSYLGPDITSFEALYGHKPPNIARSIYISPDYSATLDEISSRHHQLLDLHLEDKVNLKGGSNVMNTYPGPLDSPFQEKI